ncbi:MAG: energy transducer TonB [Hymenobacteraceae bacterium]|nr:energy transducer TonB [Hymenobacteraceae bacterium]
MLEPHSVKVSLLIDEKGSSSEFRVDEKECAKLVEEAKQIVLNSSNMWLPATSNGVPVKVRHSFRVYFISQ